MNVRLAVIRVGSGNAPAIRYWKRGVSAAMIWHSIFLMTSIDLLIMGVVGVSLWVLYKNRVGVRKPQMKFGPLMIVIGLILIGSFYLGDFLIMHVLPVFITTEEAIHIMEDVHLNYSWPVILFGTASIVVGFTLINRDFIFLIKNLESSKKN